MKAADVPGDATAERPPDGSGLWYRWDVAADGSARVEEVDMRAGAYAVGRNGCISLWSKTGPTGRV